MKNINQEFNISTDKSKLDIATIHDYLSNRSYWAKGRSLETVNTSIENSLCFGMYDELGKQIGFARVATDFALFAYIMDVCVFEEFRGQGFGKVLMNYIINYPSLQGIRRIMLATKDAHGLYEKYGFKVAAQPETIMELIKN